MSTDLPTDMPTDMSNVDTTLMAFRAQEERACAGYLAARKAMVTTAARLASYRQLVAEHPARVDYREAFYSALDAYNAAVARTRLAYNRYIRSQVRTDAQWTITEGRYPRVLADRDDPDAAADRSMGTAAGEVA